MADLHTLNDLKRGHVRMALANLLGCSKEQVTLARLASMVGDPLRARVLDVRSRLMQSSSSLCREYRATAMLLMDCVRFNQAVLSTIFRDSELTMQGYGESRVVNVKY